MSRVLMHAIGSPLERWLSPSDLQRQREHVERLEADLLAKLTEARAGWGAEYVERVHEKGKLTAAERIDRLKDATSPVFELGTLVNWGVTFQGSKRAAPGAGVFTVLVQVHGRWVVVIANDNTVASGAWWPRSPEKIERAQQLALSLRLPVIYLVDCSGLFLPEQSRSFSGRTGAGHIFTCNARLADAGVPQLAGVFGDCIAGGGYMPIISDRVYMTESAYMVIAGAALVRGAKARKLTSLDIGGPEVHVHLSRCADVRVPDDLTALDQLRAEVARLPSSGADFYRHGVEPEPPRFDPAELGSLFPADFRQTYPIEEVLARLVDGSLFHEVLPGIGREMVTGVARIGGLWVGLIANRQGLIDEPGVGRRPGGALYREGIAKISAFARCCSDDGLPLIWLQDISGFDIGEQAERLGLLGFGSNLIYTNSTPRSPVISILLRKASGAGYYAMAGMPYEPVVQLSTPLTRLSVMEGRTLAIATYNSRLDDDFEIATSDPAEREEIERGMAKVAARIEADMDPVAAASRMDTDEVVPLGRLRDWLVCLVEAAWQSNGYRRTKNPRIWSLHDLEVLVGATAWAEGAPLVAEDAEQGLTSPTVGSFVPVVSAGSLVPAGGRLGHLVRAGVRHEVRSPVAASVARVVSGNVVYGEVLAVKGQIEVRESAAVAPVDEAGGVAVVAETDGSVYLRPEPGAPAFVSVGQAVAPGQTLALIEVMKTFHPVRAVQAGRLLRVVVPEGGSVEAGQVLFWIQADPGGPTG